MTTPTSPLVSRLEALRHSPLAQAAAVFVLILALQIPILFIQSLVWERDRTRQEAVSGIAAAWGLPQEIVGPFLVVPYTCVVTELDGESGQTVRTVQRRSATFLARKLAVATDLAAVKRKRGIFEAPVYEGWARLEGVFERPDFSDWDVDPERIEWERARLALEVSDARAIQTGVRFLWQDRELRVEPGAERPGAVRAGVHAAAPVPADGPLEFEIELEFQGSSSWRTAPLAEETVVRLTSNWPDPSFQGAWLPQTRTVTDDGFEATWQVPYLGRDYPQRWRDAGPQDRMTAASLFGVDLLSPVDAYRQAERSLKYQILFIGLTFVTIWLFEVLQGARVHFIQYGLVGAALCLFFLLELSLAEHMGFGWAYLIAAATVVAMIVGYARSALGSATRAGAIGAVLIALYACLYVLLQIQDYALLIGSLGLAAVLAAIMYLTRNVDWYTARAGRSEEAG